MKPSIFHRLGFAFLWLCVGLVVLLSAARTLELYYLSKWQAAERPLIQHYEQLAGALRENAVEGGTASDDDRLDESSLSRWWRAESKALAAERQLARLPVYRFDHARADKAEALHQSLQSFIQATPAALSLQKQLREAMRALQQGWQAALDSAFENGTLTTQRPEVMATLYAQAHAFEELSEMAPSSWMDPQRGPAHLSELKRRLELSQTSFDALLVGNSRLQIEALESGALRRSLINLREPMQQLARRLQSTSAAGSPMNEHWSLQRQIAQQLRELAGARVSAVPVMPTWAAIHESLMPLAALFALLSVALAYLLAGHRRGRLELIAAQAQQRDEWQKQLAKHEENAAQLRQALQSLQRLLLQLRSSLKPLLWPAWPEPDPLPAIHALCRQLQAPVSEQPARPTPTGAVDDDTEGASSTLLEDAHQLTERLQTLHLNLSLEAARQPALSDLVVYGDELLMQWREMVSSWQQQVEARALEIEHLRGDLTEQIEHKQRLESTIMPALEALDQLQRLQRITDKRRERNLLLQQLAQQLDQCSELIQPWREEDIES